MGKESDTDQGGRTENMWQYNVESKKCTDIGEERNIDHVRKMGKERVPKKTEHLVWWVKDSREGGWMR